MIAFPRLYLVVEVRDAAAVASFGGNRVTTVPRLGDSYTYPFRISQEQIEKFAELTGDTNPLHFDAEVAAAGEFGGPIAHGVLILGVFSKIFGTILYADGQVVLGLDIRFLAPVRPELTYTAVVTVAETLLKKNQVVYRTEVFAGDGSEVLKGTCRILNRKHYVAEVQQELMGSPGDVK